MEGGGIANHRQQSSHWLLTGTWRYGCDGRGTTAAIGRRAERRTEHGEKAALEIEQIGISEQGRSQNIFYGGAPEGKQLWKKVRFLFR